LSNSTFRYRNDEGVCPAFVERLVETPSRQQQTQRTLLDWLRVEYGIGKPSNKLLALTELDSNTWVSEVKRIRGKKRPLTSAGLQALRDEHTRTIAPTRALSFGSVAGRWSRG
jgi:hypothetical protein